MVRIRHLALVSAIALAVPSTLQARQVWPPQSGYSGAYQQAYNEGYQRGVRAGENDARERRPFNFADESDYRDGDRGYRSQYGNRDLYRRDFRYGFEEGYRAGYQRYGYDSRNDPRYGGGGFPWPNRSQNNPWPNQRYDLAYETGYNDGYEAGLKDGRDRRRNDPFGEGRFRSATHGYENWYGSKESYKMQYRDAFKQGYGRGYADGRSYNNRGWRWPF